MDNEVIVSVLCTAYNHEKFIKDAIESVVNQKTDFRYEVIIHDDASTDRTAEIIEEYEKKYPHMIKTILQKENQLQKGSNICKEYLFPQAKGKYIAFCECDDYWTDENKLQRQVDFLEAHREYSMCMHNAVKLNYVTGEKKLLDTFAEDGTYTQEEQILAGLGTDFPAFASYLLRAEWLNNIPDFFFESKVLDYPIRQYYAHCGKVYYFKKPMSVYRVFTPNSYMKKTSKDQLFYNDYTLEMINFFEKFNIYTGQKFNHILEDKIISDYLGFCSSITENEGLKKAFEKGLNVSRVKECYKCLSLEYLDSSIKQVCKKTEYLFIYGTSRLAMICKKQLEFAGIHLEGFVVSDGQMKLDQIEDKNVYYLSEVLVNYKNPGFVLAIQPVNVNVVAEILEKKGEKNYCKPYMIKM